MPEDKVEGERDVEVQRHSTDRLAAIEHGIKGILHSSKTRKVHTLVRRRAVDRITVAIDYFQELPQLLDRKLKAFIGEVSDAFVEYLEIHKHRYLQDAGRRKEDVLPLPRAVCYILYTFCKVRGQNIITQLLHNEPRYLEPMFEAFLLWNPWITKSRGPIPFDEDICTWQERYVMLIWLCHLLLVPNDLTNVFPEEFGDELTMPPLLMPVPRSLPAISRRLIQTATFFLDKAGPERGPAVKLLLRLTLRTDMSRANLDQWMIPWTVSLVEEVDLAQTSDVFFAHSALSFMGDFLKTADERTLICNFSSVWKLAQTTLNDEQCQSALFATGGIGALTVKLYRELGSVAYPIRWGDQEDILQAVISFLLSMLADESTTVRFKASKALGVVSSQIGQDLAEEVLDQILSDLSEDFNEIDQSSISAHDQQYKKTPLTHQNATSDEQYLPPKVQLAIETPDIDYQMSNANLWHGYVLAIAHLLFRRAVPVTSLSRIASVLTKAMSFNQQNIQGARVGENVRDAAIFSVWALSRKYKTNETFSPDHSFMHDLSFQLVSLACFDPAGNIRRGASAALQEMVGRHPNKIKEGLGLVRIVDYYAVASRTNAMLKVASEVLRLLNDDQTALLLFLGLKGWRGFQSRDVADRRLAAQSIGYLSVASLNTFNQFTFFWQAAYAASNGEAVLHSSLLMALGAMLDTIHGMWQSHDNDRRMHDILSKDRTRIEARTSDAVASGSLPMDWKIPIAALKSLQGEGALSSGADSGSMQEAVCLFVQSFASIAGYSHRNLPFYIPLPSEEEVKEQIRDVERCLLSSDSAVQRVCAGALHALLCLASSGLLQNTVHRWLQYLGNPEARKLQKVICLTESIGLMFHLFEAPSRQSVVSYIDCRNATLNMINQLLSEPWEEIRCAALRAATEGPIKCNITNAALFSAIENSLTDFSIDHQSRDVGSSVRLEAITATELLLQTPSDNLLDSQARQRLIILLCALAVEYYDKIRVEATSCLRRNWQAFGLFSFTYPPSTSSTDPTTSPAHFRLFLTIFSSYTPSHPQLTLPILTSFLTSTTTSTLSTPALSALASHITNPPPSRKSPDSLIQILNGIYTLLSPSPDPNPDQRAADRTRTQALLLLAHIVSAGFLPSLFPYLPPSLPSPSSPPISTTPPTTPTPSLPAPSNPQAQHDHHTQEDGAGKKELKSVKPAFTLKSLFAAVTKSHYQSHDLRKLGAAVEVYAAFASLSSYLLPTPASNSTPASSTSADSASAWMGKARAQTDRRVEIGEEEGKGRVQKEGMADKVEEVKKLGRQRLLGMLVCPFATIRNAAADAIYIITGDEGMMGVEWGDIKRAKGDVERVRDVLLG